MDIYYQIERLLNYALQQQLIYPADVIYVRNQYYFALGLDYPAAENMPQPAEDTRFGYALIREVNETLPYPDEILDILDDG